MQTTEIKKGYKQVNYQNIIIPGPLESIRIQDGAFSLKKMILENKMPNQENKEIILSGN